MSTNFSTSSSATFKKTDGFSLPKHRKKNSNTTMHSASTQYGGNTHKNTKGNSNSNSNSSNSNSNSNSNNSHLIQTTHYENVYLHDIVGRLTLTPDKIVFQPHDRSDTEHHFGWGWESLEKHVISAPPANDSEVDQCWLRLISHEDSKKTVMFHFSHNERDKLHQLHQDISDKMAGLRKYRKVKSALLDARAKHRQANQTIDELQDQNQQLLDSFETAAQKATRLGNTCQEQAKELEQLRAENQQLKANPADPSKLKRLQERFEQLNNEKTARDIEHEMDQQEWKHQKWDLERQLKDAMAELERHKKENLEELQLEIRLLSKEVLELQSKHGTLLNELWAQEAEYEEMLWKVRRQRNNAWLELKRVQEERDSWKKMKGPAENSSSSSSSSAEEEEEEEGATYFKTKEELMQEPKDDPLVPMVQATKVPLSHSALYGKVFQTLHYDTQNSNNVADLQQYYETMCQVASRSEDGLTLLQRELEALLDKESMPHWQHYYVGPNDEVPTTAPRRAVAPASAAQYYEDLGLDSASAYSMLGYCTIDCRVNNKNNEFKDKKSSRTLEVNFANNSMLGNRFVQYGMQQQHCLTTPEYPWMVPEASLSLPNKSSYSYYNYNRSQDVVEKPVLLDNSWIHSHVRRTMPDDGPSSRSSSSNIPNVVVTMDHGGTNNNNNNNNTNSNKNNHTIVLSNGIKSSIDFRVQDMPWQYEMEDEFHSHVPHEMPPRRTPSKLKAEATLQELAFAF